MFNPGYLALLTVALVAILLLCPQIGIIALLDTMFLLYIYWDQVTER